MTKKKQLQWNINDLNESFERSLLAENLSPHTIRATYREVDQAYILREVKYASLFP